MHLTLAWLQLSQDARKVGPILLGRAPEIFVETKDVMVFV